MNYAALDASIGGSQNFEDPIALAQGTAGETVIVAATAGRKYFLHALIGTVDAEGTIAIRSTGDTVLCGAMPWGTNGGAVIPFTENPKGCLRSVDDEGLEIFTVTGKFFGYAVVSWIATE